MSPPTVLIYRNQLAQPSEGFIVDQAAAMNRYSPVFVGWSSNGNTGFPTISLDDQRAHRALRTKLTGFAKPLTERIESRPHLVHAHFAIDSAYAIHLARKFAIPLITTLHGFDVSVSRKAMITSGNPSWYKYLLYRNRLLNHTSIFLCVSKHIERLALANGFPRDKLVRAYIGVDLEKFKFRSPQSTVDPVILHVGRLVEKKGTSDLLKAFRTVLDVSPRCTLRIIGEGPLRASLEREANLLGISHATRFLGSMSQSAVRSELASATIFALPSRTASNGDTEGLPVSILEACASGVPVVSTAHAGIPEVIENAESGFLVEERDVATLSNCLAELVGDVTLRRNLSSSARTVVESWFDLNTNTESLEQIYDSVVGRG